MPKGLVRADGVLEWRPQSADPPQAWFWTKRWQRMECEAGEAYAEGGCQTFDTMEESSPIWMRMQRGTSPPVLHATVAAPPLRSFAGLEGRATFEFVMVDSEPALRSRPLAGMPFSAALSAGAVAP